MTQHQGVSIAGASALVTGANRGLGRSFVQELLDRGAGRVFAGARNPASVDFSDERVVPVKLDITKRDDVEAAAALCGEVSVLVNNAGAMLKTPLLAAPDDTIARAEMETNYFGTLAMSRAFAPLLAASGGGALVNMLSVVSFYAAPFNASYCASKSAQWALTNALRTELHAQGTLVVGVHAGFIDTDMAASVVEAKISPREVAAQALEAVERGKTEVLTDDWTRYVKASLPTDQSTLYPEVVEQWEANNNPWQD
ncbi:NAD(P)-dependent dehydrogenase (short-subunit alcohol dehydrogenase family) [Mycobacterium sp. MAA66]|uniref:SDR family oxidoreductase n=1 Tax=Mycobacterium sp. MAA66 TaxID=3156297 RepID=UPI003516C2B5